MDNKRKHKLFSFTRVFAVTGRILKQFKRDRATFGMMIFMPILFMFVFGLTLSGNITNVPIVIENLDEGLTNPFTNDTKILADDIVAKLALDDRVDMSQGSYINGIDDVEAGELVASIRFDTNFTKDMLTIGNTTITIYIDATKPQIRGVVYNAISDAIQEVLEGRGISFDEHIAFGGAEFSGLDVSIPGVMGYILTFLILLISVLTVIREDIGKTKLRLFTTPLKPVERILGYVLALSIFAMLETALVLGIAIYIFGTVVQGSILLLFFAGFIYGMANIFLAFLLSNFAKNELQSVQLAVLIAIPSLAFSGMMIPIPSLPPIIAAISKYVPLTYGIIIFEGIMLRGWGIEELWFEFSLILILAVVFFVLALISSSDKSKE